MPRFFVRTTETSVVYYDVIARGPNDAANKVIEVHDSAVMVDTIPMDIEITNVEEFR